MPSSRTGRNGWYGIVSLLRQSVYGRLAGYDDVNDADRLGRDPTMRWIVGGKAVERGGASTSQMGRFERPGLLANNENLAADYSVVVVLSGLLPPNAPIMSVLLTVPPMCSCSAPMNRPVTKPCS